MKNKEIKVGDIVYFAGSFADYNEPEEYWVIEKHKVKEITPRYYAFEDSPLVVNKVFLSLGELIDDLRNYLKETYGYKWKETFIEEVINKTLIRFIEEEEKK